MMRTGEDVLLKSNSPVLLFSGGVAIMEGNGTLTIFEALKVRGMLRRLC